MTAPRARFGLTAWTPDGVIARMLSVGAPAEPGTDLPGPLAWGDAP